MTMRDAFTEQMTTLLDDDERVVVITADIGAARFADAAVRHPQRVINVGIREQAMIGVAAGFALEGYRPFVHSYAPFLTERPYEQIKLDLVHQDAGAVLVSIGGSYDAAAEGRTHQAPGDVAALATLPDVRIHVPGHPDEVADLMRRAARERGTSYIRLVEQSNVRAFPADGAVKLVRRGSDDSVSVLAIGPMLDPVLEAVRDIDATVLHASTVLPLDEAGLRASSGEHVIVVEPYLEGTTLPMIVSALAGRSVRLTAIGVGRHDLRRYGSWRDHERAHGLDPVGIRRRLADAGIDLVGSNSGRRARPAAG